MTFGSTHRLNTDSTSSIGKAYPLPCVAFSQFYSIRISRWACSAVHSPSSFSHEATVEKQRISAVYFQTWQWLDMVPMMVGWFSTSESADQESIRLSAVGCLGPVMTSTDLAGAPHVASSFGSRG